MNVRLATPADLDTVVWLGLQMSDDLGMVSDKAVIRERAEAMIDASRRACILLTQVDIGDEPFEMGVLAATIGPVHIGTADLESTEVAFWVVPEFRNGGAGSLLVSAWEAWAAARGAQACVWAHGSGVEKYAKACAALAESEGYEPAGLAYRKRL